MSIYWVFFQILPKKRQEPGSQVPAFFQLWTDVPYNHKNQFLLKSRFLLSCGTTGNGRSASWRQSFPNQVLKFNYISVIYKGKVPKKKEKNVTNVNFAVTRFLPNCGEGGWWLNKLASLADAIAISEI